LLFFLFTAFVPCYSIFKSVFSYPAKRVFNKLKSVRCTARPPNTVYVTTLPCKNLNHNFTYVLHIYYH